MQYPFQQQQAQTQAATYDEGLRRYMLGIYNYMASGLALTGIVAWLAANTPALMNMFYQMQDGYLVGMTPLGWIVAFAPLAFVLFLSVRINKMSFKSAQLAFWAFAVTMGLSLASIFLIYTGASIARVFLITSITFGAMSLYGYTTKKDLSSWGSFLIMGVFGIIIASIVNIFIQSSALYFAVSIIGVLLFVGLTAYDTQRLKTIYYQIGGDSAAIAKAGLMGALALYLDFINLFIMLLRLMGDRR